MLVKKQKFKNVVIFEYIIQNLVSTDFKCNDTQKRPGFLIGNFAGNDNKIAIERIACKNVTKHALALKFSHTLAHIMYVTYM